MNSKEALQIEKENRKALSKKRTTFLVLGLDVALIVYIVIQVFIIIQK